MLFSDLEFVHENDYPWEEASMESCIFEDHSVCVYLWDDGQFGEESEDDVKSQGPVKVTAYYDVSEKIVDFHREAFKHFIDNAKSYEKRLLAYLADIAKNNIELAMGEADSPEIIKFIEKHKLYGIDGLKKQISWSGITLYDHGWEGVGFVTFDFECAWDTEHGISILMHKGKIIAEGGEAEFTGRGDSLIKHAEYSQKHTAGYDIELPYGSS